MAAPTSLANWERSRIRVVWPARRRAMAQERPQMPPPAIIISRGCEVMAWLGLFLDSMML